MANRPSGRRKWIGLAVGLLIVAAAAAALGWRWWSRSHGGPAESALFASGVIEVEEVKVASELGGRVVLLYVDEGDEVQVGDLLLQLDDELLRTQLAQAEAVVDAARAAVERAELGATDEEILQAKAGLLQAIAARDGALLVWRAAQAVAEDPQQIIAQYHAARGTREVAEQQAISVAQTGLTMKENAVRLWHDAANNLRDAQAAYTLIYWQNRESEKRRELTQAEKDAEAAAWRRVENAERLMQMGELNTKLAETLEIQNNAIAQSNLATAQALTADLGWMISEPLSIEAQAAQALAQYEQAKAAVRVAHAALGRLQAGASRPELDVLRAQVRQAQAAADALRLQVERTTLRAPVSGIVLIRSIHQGELAAPGMTLLTVGDLDTVRLTIYLPENLYGQVQIGQQVNVYVDSYPGQAFEGEIVHIATQAEFTPKDVQTQEERVHLVYAVRVRVPNPEHLLKPGMPADAEIELERE